MTTETLTEVIIYDRFLKWIESLDAHHDDSHLIQKFIKDNEIDRNSPLAMMFEAFAGGMEAGAELQEQLNKQPTDE